MAALGKALRRHYEGALADRQFRKDRRLPDWTTYSRGNRDFLTFDRMKGGALRLRLGIGIPEPEIEAASPSWDIREGPWPDYAPPELNPEDFTLEHALKCAWEFLGVCGFMWFDDPMALTPTEWRVRHKLLLRDNRRAEITLSWPASMPANERIIRSKHCVPSFRGLSALQLRGYFVGVDRINLGHMPLANALELKKAVEEAGLTLELNVA